MSKKMVILLFSAAMANHCSATKMNEGKKDSQNSKTAEAEKAEEEVTPPVQISGAFLRCAEESSANETKPDALYGCRLTASDGTRSQVATERGLRYGWRSAGATTLKVLSRVPAQDNRYDVLYLFRGASLGELTQEIAKVQIVIEEPAGAAFDEALSQPLTTVTVAPSVFPEPRASDYEAIKVGYGDELDASDNPTPPFPE